MKVILFLLIGILTLFGDEASYNRGETLYFQRGCNSCHGPDAEGSNMYPKLANKSADYLQKRLKHYKEEELLSVSEEMMNQFVRTLTKKQLQDLIYFLSHHKKPKEQEVSDDILGGFGS